MYTRLRLRFVVGLLSAATLLGALPLALQARTAHAPMSGGKASRTFCFAVFGDNRPGGHAIETTPTFRRIMSELSALKPDFVVNTGDLVDGETDTTRYQEQMDAVKKVVKASGLKLYVAPGNHDIKNKETLAIFQRTVDESYFSFDHDGSHFIIISTQIPGEQARITGAQLEWLENDLKSHQSENHRFVFYHQPMWPVGLHIGSSMDVYPKDRDNLAELFKKYRVDAAFAGHEHLFHYTDKNGLVEYITGGGGAGLYHTLVGDYGGYHHYLWVTVSPHQVRVQVVRPGHGFRGTSSPPGTWMTPTYANTQR